MLKSFLFFYLGVNNEMVRVFILRLCYDNSDIMTDYYHPRASFMEWMICDFEGKRVTEAKLRRALNRCPEWIRGYAFKYKKTYYGKPYLESEGIGLTKKRTYGGYERPFFFVVEETAFDVDEARIPESLEELKEVVERREREILERHERNKKKIYEAHIKTIQESQAIIGANGFELLTPEKKQKEIEKILNKAIQERAY